jgi:hypothetical protein
VLKRYDIENCKVLSTLIYKGWSLSKVMCSRHEEGIQEMRNVSYAQVVRSLMYAMTSTRSNICHTVGLVSMFQPTLGKEH